MYFCTSKEPLILITQRLVSLCLQASSMEKILFNSLSEKHNKAPARHHLESIPPPKQLQILPIVILLHVPSKTPCIKDWSTACSGIQLNHEPWGCDSQTGRKLLSSSLQLLWLSCGVCGGRKKMEDNSLNHSVGSPLTISNTKLLAQKTSLPLRGSCSSFFISTTQHPGSAKPLSGAR